jgi:hypothetical protein
MKIFIFFLFWQEPAESPTLYLPPEVAEGVKKSSPWIKPKGGLEKL